MITRRPSNERGHANHGWLDTFHTFSFADYHDPAHMGFRALRVINEDRVQAGRGFPTHPHADMEILTFVLAGALTHADSMGTGSTIRPGDVQRMSAGTGVTHSEFNASRTDPVHLLQIWILPEQRGLRPEYEQKAFPEAERRGRLRLIASQDGADGAVTLHQDVRLYATVLDSGQQVTQALAPGRFAWVQVARGAVALNGSALAAGDGAAIQGESQLEIVANGAAGTSELLLFDLA
jgi:redox-sensitive bicupin YhaK (pirin superfamily)